MERIVTHLDQHGRMLIPVQIREKFNIEPGNKVVLEISDGTLKILNANHIIDEMHSIFTKHQNGRKDSIVEDFIEDKRKDFKIEQTRDSKYEGIVKLTAQKVM